MYNMNSGYSGFSMSNRAVEAYNNGEKPLSKWTKKAIIEAITEYSDENEVTFPVDILIKTPAPVLKELVLVRSSWHHTSSYANPTEFYSVDFDKLLALSKEDIIAASERVVDSQMPPNKYKGNIDYLEWSGTRKHPKATRCSLKNVNIEEKGSFYVITDDTGKVILRKKIGSNGTFVSRNS